MKIQNKEYRTIWYEENVVKTTYCAIRFFYQKGVCVVDSFTYKVRAVVVVVPQMLFFFFQVRAS